jgi:hypothetical protein
VPLRSSHRLSVPNLDFMTPRSSLVATSRVTSGLDNSPTTIRTRAVIVENTQCAVHFIHWTGASNSMRKRTQKSLLFWAASMLASFALPVIGSVIGKAGYCKPAEVDGQCGMSTFVSFAYGVLGGIVVAVCCTAYLFISLYKQRKTPSSPERFRADDRHPEVIPKNAVLSG